MIDFGHWCGKSQSDIYVSPKLNFFFNTCASLKLQCDYALISQGHIEFSAFYLPKAQHLTRRYTFWCAPSKGYFQRLPLFSVPQRDLLPLSLVPLRRTATIWRKWQSLLNHSVVFLLLSVSKSLDLFVSLWKSCLSYLHSSEGGI